MGVPVPVWRGITFRCVCVPLHSQVLFRPAEKARANFMGQIGCPIFGTNIDSADNEIKN